MDSRISVVKPYPNLRVGVFIETEASTDYEVVIGSNDIYVRSAKKKVFKHSVFDYLTFKNGEYNKFCVINFNVLANRDFKEFLKDKGFLVYGELPRRDLIEFWWQINLHDLINFLPEFNANYSKEFDLVVNALDRITESMIKRKNFFTELIQKYLKFVEKKTK